MALSVNRPYWDDIERRGSATLPTPEDPKALEAGLRSKDAWWIQITQVPAPTEGDRIGIAGLKFHGLTLEQAKEIAEIFRQLSSKTLQTYLENPRESGGLSKFAASSILHELYLVGFADKEILVGELSSLTEIERVSLDAENKNYSVRFKKKQIKDESWLKSKIFEFRKKRILEWLSRKRNQHG